MQAKLIADLFLDSLAELEEKPRAQTLAYFFDALGRETPTKPRKKRYAGEMTRERIVEVLVSTDGNVNKAYVQLGCSRRTLQNKMRKFGIAPGKPGGVHKSPASVINSSAGGLDDGEASETETQAD